MGNTQIEKRDDFEGRNISLNPENNDTIKCYTDGSKTEHGVGCSYVIRGENYMKHKPLTLVNHATVFQAEVMAIEKACETILENRIQNKEIIFYVDSQAAIRATEKYLQKSVLVN